LANVAFVIQKLSNFSRDSQAETKGTAAVALMLPFLFQLLPLWAW